MEITKETVRELKYGHTVVGTTAVQLANSCIAHKGVLLRTPGSADPTPNTACVWAGGGGVTANSAATGGMPIPPGEALFIPIEDPSLIWVISEDPAQDIAWMAI